MDDTKLLELASKAANENYGPDNNPLEDDSLALRLAVKLKIDVCSEYWNDDESVQAQNDNGDICVEQKGLDPYAATRRAIVRAAAEIESAYDRQSA